MAAAFSSSSRLQVAYLSVLNSLGHGCGGSCLREAEVHARGIQPTYKFLPGDNLVKLCVPHLHC